MNEQLLRILAIEDSESDFALIERHLHRHGLTVEMLRASDGPGLATALSSGQWDLVLADYRVPGMVFEETLALLAQCLPDVPVLLVSGSVGEECAVELLKRGVWDFIRKDNLVRLVPGIERSLREAHERRALRDKQDDLASVVASVPGLICAYRLRPDGSSCIPYASPAALDLYGLAPADLARDTAPLFARMHPEDAARVQRTIARCARTMRLWHDEFRYSHPSKGERWIEGWSVPRREQDGSILWFGYVQDITERKVSDKALRDSQERLLAMIENATGIAWVKDLQGRFVLVNRYAERILGVPRGLILGRRVFDLLSADQARECAAHDMRVLDSGEPLELEEPIEAAGQFHWLLTRRFPLRDSEGRIYALGALSMDITGRKRIETALSERCDRLEALLARGTDELAAARREAEAARERARCETERQAQVKAELLANLSQEIRGPLDALQGLVQIGRGAADGPQIEDYFLRIQCLGELLNGIVDDMLDLSRIEAGKLVLEHRPFDLGPVLDRAVDLNARAAFAKGVGLAVDEAPDLPLRIQGDARRIGQILANLLAHAVKLAELGSIDLSARRDGADLRVQIVYTGIGLHPSRIERLLAPFQTAQEPAARGFDGSVLGLAVSRHLARLMGGDIAVESREHGGGAFTLRIPGCLADAPPPAPPTPAPGLVALAGLPAAEAERLAKALGALGLRVELRPAGRALEAPADLILLDGDLLTDATLRQSAERGLARGQRLALVYSPGASQLLPGALHGQVQILLRPLRARLALRAFQEPLPGARAPEGHSPPPGAPSPTAAASPACAPLPSAQSPDAARETIDWDRLEARYAGNPDFVDRLVRLVLENQYEQQANLRAAIPSGDFARLAAIAHAVKGSAANLCAAALQDLAARTEQAARARDPQAKALAEDLAQLLERMPGDVRLRQEKRGAAAG